MLRADRYFTTRFGGANLHLFEAEELAKL